MPDVIITPASGIIEFKPSSTTVNKIEASGTTVNLVNTVSASGTIFNIEGTNGSLFSVVDNLSGTLMSVNNNAGLPVLEVFSDDRVVAGRFGQNDLVVSSSGNVGIGKVPSNDYKLDVNGTVNINNGNYSGKIYVNEFGDGLELDASNTAAGEISLNSRVNMPNGFSAGTLGEGLYIDIINDRVGILTTSPTTELDVNGTVKATTFSGAGTSLTGTAASLTAGSVTTNANLTGDVTSVGNATSIASGVIVNADINANAAIADTKLATISTAGKVANSATTATNANTASAIVARDASGNFSAGTITATLSGNASTVTNGVYTTGNQSVGGVKTFTNQIINTTANNVNTGGGQIYLNGSTGNRIDFNTNGVAPPTFNARSAGTKLVLYPAVGASAVDFGFGIENSTLWLSVAQTTNQFKWYAGTTNVATLSGDGQLTLTSNAGYTTPTLTLLADSTTDGAFRFFPMADGAGGYITFNSSANTTTNGVLIGGTSTMTGYHAGRRQGAFQWIGGSIDSTSRFEFLTANGGTTAQIMTSRMAITAEGRVGIGTNTPTVTLDVNGSIKSTQLDIDNLRLDGNTLSATNSNGNIYLSPNGLAIGNQLVVSQTNGGPTMEFINGGPDTLIFLDGDGAAGTSFKATSSGGGGTILFLDHLNAKVGIGTNTPAVALDVNGNISCDGISQSTVCVFKATDNQPPATNFATLDTRNSVAVLDFDDSTKESAIFVSVIPNLILLGSGLSISIHWMATSATSGSVVWEVSLERSNTDLDSDSFDTAATGSSSTNGTSGIITKTTITLTSIDGVTIGDLYRLKVSRDVSNASDTMVGDAELIGVEIRSIG